MSWIDDQLLPYVNQFLKNRETARAPDPNLPYIKRSPHIIPPHHPQGASKYSRGGNGYFADQLPVPQTGRALVPSGSSLPAIPDGSPASAPLRGGGLPTGAGATAGALPPPLGGGMFGTSGGTIPGAAHGIPDTSSFLGRAASAATNAMGPVAPLAASQPSIYPSIGSLAAAHHQPLVDQFHLNSRPNPQWVDRSGKGNSLPNTPGGSFMPIPNVPATPPPAQQIPLATEHMTPTPVSKPPIDFPPVQSFEGAITNPRSVTSAPLPPIESQHDVMVPHQASMSGDIPSRHYAPPLPLPKPRTALRHVPLPKSDPRAIEEAGPTLFGQPIEPHLASILKSLFGSPSLHNQQTPAGY